MSPTSYRAAPPRVSEEAKYSKLSRPRQTLCDFFTMCIFSCGDTVIFNSGADGEHPGNVGAHVSAVRASAGVDVCCRVSSGNAYESRHVGSMKARQPLRLEFQNLGWVDHAVSVVHDPPLL